MGSAASTSRPPEREDDAAAPHWRTLQYLGLARLIITIGLLLAIAALGATIRGWSSPAYVAAASLYFAGAAALAVASICLRRRAVVHITAQIAFDLALISALMIASGGLRSGLVVLYLLPLAGASLLLPTAPVFFVCSLAVITILLDTLARSLAVARTEASLFEAGLYGAMMLAITALLRLLAERLAAQEQLAQQRGGNLHNQLAINRLVIAQLEQGVVVVDADARVRANNRAARVLIGMKPEAQLTGERLASVDPRRRSSRASRLRPPEARSSPGPDQVLLEGCGGETASRPIDPRQGPDGRPLGPCRRAAGRLKASGLVPKTDAFRTSPEAGKSLAAALLFPLSDRDIMYLARTALKRPSSTV